MNSLIIFLVLLTLGYFVGSHLEKRHYQSIRRREAQLQRILTFNERFPPVMNPAPNTRMVTGNVVISVDYFKVFVAGLRNLVGGRISSYESLIDRARREAILRMKEEAQQHGAEQIFNVRLETASISKNAKNGIGSIEALAYGTALIPTQPTSAH